MRSDIRCDLEYTSRSGCRSGSRGDIDDSPVHVAATSLAPPGNADGSQPLAELSTTRLTTTRTFDGQIDWPTCVLIRVSAVAECKIVGRSSLSRRRGHHLVRETRQMPPRGRAILAVAIAALVASCSLTSPPGRGAVQRLVSVRPATPMRLGCIASCTRR